MHSHLCATITTIHLQNFSIFANRNSAPIKQWLPIPLSPRPLVATILLSIPTSLTAPGLSHKWNHAVFVFSDRLVFTQHNIFKVHPCCSICQNFPLSQGGIIFHCKYIIHFAYLSVSIHGKYISNEQEKQIQVFFKK